MQAVVLAGGLGTRLRPSVAGVPKALAPVAGLPFISYLLTHLYREGVRNVLMCTGHMHNDIVGYVGDGHGWGVQVRYSREMEPLGTAGALCHAHAQFETDPLLVLNGDTLALCRVDDVVQHHKSHGAAATVVAVDCGSVADFGALLLNDEGLVLRFSEKSADGGPTSPWVSAGVYLFSRRFLDFMLTLTMRPLSLESDVFPQYLAQARDMYGFIYDGYFIDIGVADRYARASREIPGLFRP